ncbi:MAG: 50S ribosomal protein L15 [Planctomycetes bacterium]|nr:50S ribosomal protein L15 [Planctomycetota bacterium]
MNITDINKLSKPHKRRKRVGRGEASGTGKTAGRGHKGFGQRNSKSLLKLEGGQMQIFRTAPKRGFNNAIFRKVYQPVNLADLERLFEIGETVDPATLKAKGYCKKIGNIKVLANGSLTKKLTVKAHAFSKTAREKIEQAGGSVEIMGQATTPKPTAGKAETDA